MKVTYIRLPVVCVKRPKRPARPHLGHKIDRNAIKNNPDHPLNDPRHYAYLKDPPLDQDKEAW